MAIKEIPTNYRVYYKSMRNAYTQIRDEALSNLNKLEESEFNIYKTVDDNVESYKNEFNIDLYQYEEYKNNNYIDGTFLKTAKGAFINRKNNYTLVTDLFNLYNLAKKQKEIYDVKNDIELYDKILSLKLKDYNNILKVFYSKVHERMILKGEGYVFENQIGWTCINRCHIEKSSPHINFIATQKRREQLKAEGKRIYNKEEAAWCKANGIEYDAVDPRVYLNDEYCYEIPLLGCKLPNGYKYKLDITDYRNRSLRGKTNKELLLECNNDVESICNLPVDLRTKLNMCVEVDKTLYTNFIRNENQKPINTSKAGRKNRQ